MVYSTTERVIRTVPFYDLLCEITLQSDGSEDLILSVTDSIHLNALLEKRFSRATSNQISNANSGSENEKEKEHEEDIQVGEDGAIRMIVEPVVTDDNVRRSKRVRNARVITDS